MPLRYQMPYDGGATLVIEKPDGTRVRNLIGDYPRKAGTQVDFWDGMDDDGHPVGPGTYRWRGLCHRPFDVLYEFAYGNPGNPPYQNAAGTGAWLANHDNPMAVAADEQRIYIAAPQSEGATTLLAVDYHGQRQWGHGNISGGPMVRYGKYLYMLVGGDMYHPFVPDGEVHITRLDPADGKYVALRRRQIQPQNRRDSRRYGPVARLQAPPARGRNCGRPRLRRRLVPAPEHGTGCGQGSPVRLASTTRTRLWWSTRTKAKPSGQISLERPAGLAADASGAVYALSGRRVVKIEEGGAATVIVAKGLAAPVGLATDRQGNLYVSDWGAAMCVQVFSPQGQRLRTIGRVGGRPLVGAYDPARHVPTLGPGRRSPGPFMGGRVRPHPTPRQRLEHPHRRVPARVLRHDLVRGGRGVRQCDQPPSGLRVGQHLRAGLAEGAVARDGHAVESRLAPNRSSASTAKARKWRWCVTRDVIS